jgi:translation initiation factor IF-1
MDKGEIAEVLEAYPNAQFLLRRETGETMRGYLSGVMRRNFIKVLVGDRVRVEFPDIGEIGRIIRRM